MTTRTPSIAVPGLNTIGASDRSRPPYSIAFTAQPLGGLTTCNVVGPSRSESWNVPSAFVVAVPPQRDTLPASPGYIAEIASRIGGSGAPSVSTLPDARPPG